MDVELPDGTVIQDVPDNITRAELTAKLRQNGYDVSSLETKTKSEGKGHTFKQYNPNESFLGRVFGKYLPDVLDLGAGASSLTRGVMNYANTIYDKASGQSGQNLSSLITGQKPVQWGDKYFGTENLAVPYSADKNSAMGITGQIIDPVANLVGFGTGKVAAKVLPEVIPAVTQGMPAAKEAIGRVIARSSLGAGTAGAATAALSGADLEDVALAGGYTALFGAGAPVITQALAKGAGWAVDAVKGKLAQIKAAKIARAAAGENLPAIRTALANAAPGETAAQATTGVGQPTFSALGDLASKVDRTDYYSNLAKQQVANREGMLTGVTPDPVSSKAALDTALGQYPKIITENANKVRELEASVRPAAELRITNPSTGEGYYAPSTPKPIPLPKAIEALVDEPLFKAAEKTAANAINTDVRIPMSQRQSISESPAKTLQGLHAMKKAIDEQIKNPNSTSDLASYTNSSLKAFQKQLVKAIDQIDGYGSAREGVVAAYGPVNQGNVLNELSSVLKKPTETGERVVPFLNALDRGEESALKRAGLDMRYTGGLEDVLSPDQFSAVTKVKDQLVRDAELKAQAAAGQTALTDIIDSFASKFKLPGFMSGKVTAANKALELVNRNLSENTKKALAEGMRSGKSAQELLDVLPTAEKNKLLMILSSSGADISSYMGAQVGARQ